VADSPRVSDQSALSVVLPNDELRLRCWLDSEQLVLEDGWAFETGWEQRVEQRLPFRPTKSIKRSLSSLHASEEHESSFCLIVLSEFSDDFKVMFLFLFDLLKGSIFLVFKYLPRFVIQILRFGYLYV
jgi:hypothetical protein